MGKLVRVTRRKRRAVAGVVTKAWGKHSPNSTFRTGGSSMLSSEWPSEVRVGGPRATRLGEFSKAKFNTSGKGRLFCFVGRPFQSTYDLDSRNRKVGSVGAILMHQTPAFQLLG